MADEAGETAPDGGPYAGPLLGSLEDAPEDLEPGRLMFAQETRFLLGVAALKQLPLDDIPEVAFAGRSNVGKSSLLNALTGRRDIARTSNTPGRTQELNVFRLGTETGRGMLTLVDLPGYGYARVSKEKVARWTALLTAYLRGRPQLRRALVLIDGRHGIKPVDAEMMTMLDEAAVSYQVVLTKADKVRGPERAKIWAQVERDLRAHVAAHPRVIATSSGTGFGIAELRAELARLASSPGSAQRSAP